MAQEADYFTPIAPSYWQVWFLHRRFQRWFDVFTPSWGRHVILMGYVPARDVWICMDPHETRTTLTVLSVREADTLRESVSERLSARICVRASEGSAWRSRGAYTCSSAINRVLGLPGGALTPGRLFRTLMANDGEILEDRRDRF